MKRNVLVLFGGQSGEHAVSINSAVSVIAHLNKKKYNIIPLCIDKTGRWLRPFESVKYLATAPAVKPQLLDTKLMRTFDIRQVLTASRGGGCCLKPGGGNELSTSTRDFSFRCRLAEGGSLPKVDVVIPMLHGPYGEDGTIQGFLELWGVPFVGADTLSSALAMDKVISKKIFQLERIPTPPYWVVTKKNFGSMLKRIKLPCVVKPVNLGSSVGVVIVKKQPELRLAVNSALEMDRKGEVLVEKFIKGLELTVPILGGRALPVIEIRPKPGRWFDYEVKYDPDLVEEIVPATSLSKAQTIKVQKLAWRAHQSLKCRHLSRVDFILADKDQEFYVLEVNTIPGFTSASLYPKSARAAGLSFNRLLDKLIEMALKEPSVFC